MVNLELGFWQMTCHRGLMRLDMRASALATLLLCASLAGCFGGDDDGPTEYAGPIDLIVYYDETSGTIQQDFQNGQNQPTSADVEMTFDFGSTTSAKGEIASIYLIPGDGGDMVTQNPTDGAELSYTYGTHGLFNVTLGAIDDEGNEHMIYVSIRIDMTIVWTDDNTAQSSMTFEVTPDTEDHIPLAESIMYRSSVENPPAFPLGGGNSDVTWSLKNGDDAEVDSQSGTINDGGTETMESTTRTIVAGTWTLEVVADGDNVNVDNEIMIHYLEGSESPANPRPA